MNTKEYFSQLFGTIQAKVLTQNLWEKGIISTEFFNEINPNTTINQYIALCIKELKQ